MRARATQEELERRVEMVGKMLAGGMANAEIEAIGAKVWGVSRGQVWRYIRSVGGERQNVVVNHSVDFERCTDRDEAGRKVGSAAGKVGLRGAPRPG